MGLPQWVLLCLSPSLELLLPLLLLLRLHVLGQRLLLARLPQPFGAQPAPQQNLLLALLR